jgi:3-oxoacyl-[acyl-carrier protein] reductase
MSIELKGKKALVTGGSRGIGRAVALTFAAAGAQVAAVYQNESEAVSTLREKLGSFSDKNFVAQADVSKREDVDGLLREVAERLGTVEVLVNNAGIVSDYRIQDLSDDEWDRMLSTNLTSIFRVTQGTLEMMPDNSSIVLVSSAVAPRGMVGRTHYGSAKMGMIGFMRSLSKEVGPRGIRVNTVAPGLIKTDMMANADPERQRMYTNLPALKRLGEAQEIADAVLFLASDLSAYVTGQTITVDGGI